MIGDIIAFDPCDTCENHDMCSICELTLRRDGSLRTDKWISVDERLPEEDMRVLVYINSERSYTKLDTDRMGDGEWVRWDKDITHWMPLPEVPKMKGGEE